MPPPLAVRQKDANALSASHDSSPGYSPRAFSFGDLGRPRPSARLLPPIQAALEDRADADGSSELELCADDILESNDIDSFEMAAAEIRTFPTPEPTPAPVPQSSNFVVGDLGSFPDVEVEG